MAATVTEIDVERRQFADFLATNVLAYVKHRYAVWPFAGESDEDVYRWARTEGNTKYRALEGPAILRHLTGIKTSRAVFSGVGIPLLAETNLAGMGVIDIDTHDTGIVVDLDPLAAVCDPAAVVSRSSSGRGAHIYFFPPMPVQSHVLRLALDRYVAYLLGTRTIPQGAQIDVFPKSHGTDAREAADRILSGGSVRFPLAGGRRPGFDTYPPTWEAPDPHPGQFFRRGRWVESFRECREIITEAQALHLSWLATWGGPPCVGRVLKDGADEGERNTLIYDAAYFAGFVTQDEVIASEWVRTRILPQLRGTPVSEREAERTIRSGIERSLDPTKPQYTCTTSLCSKDEGRCTRIGQKRWMPTEGGPPVETTAGTRAAEAAREEQVRETVKITTEAGPNAITVRDGQLYVGESAVRVDYCPIDDRYGIYVGRYCHRCSPVAMQAAPMIGVLASMLQREIHLPQKARRGWLVQLLMLARGAATVFPHPVYGQLKATLYAITRTKDEAVPAAAVHEAMRSQGTSSLTIDAAMRHYPGRDWQAVVAPGGEILGMRLLAPDHDFLMVAPPASAGAPPSTSEPPTDY